MIEVALGIDVGTGSTKAGLVDADGRVLAVGRCPHPIVAPRPGWSESDPASWITSARAAIAEAAAKAGTAATAGTMTSLTIAAVGFSGQMHGVVLCDRALDPVRPAVLWSDRRSQSRLSELRARFGPADLLRLANPVVAGMAGPTIAALAADEPATVDRTVTVLQAKDWVRARLTGRVATDPSDASATLLWDSSTDRWWPEACRVFDVDPAWLPPVVASSAPTGAVTDRGAAEFGLAAGVPVAAGAADTAAALLGAGLRSGETQLSTGTGGQIARLTAAPVVDRAARTHLFRAADCNDPTADRWYEMAAMQNAGIAIDWALEVLGANLTDAAQAIEGSPLGSNGVSFLPYLTGERTPHLNAGLTGSWSGLRPGTTRADLIRSVFEGVAFALRDGYDALVRNGPEPDHLLMAGGGSTAGWWRQLLADALDRPLIPHNAVDASVRGAGLLAWASVGLTIDPVAAMERQAPILPSRRGSEQAAIAIGRYRAALPCAEPAW